MPGSIDFTAKITNVGSGECIALVREIVVCYNNPTGVGATLTVACGGATVVPASLPVGAWGSACATFTVTHASAGTGHSITATMVQTSAPPGSTPQSATDEVGVKVGNPCPIIADPVEGIVGGISRINPNADLTGKFNDDLGKSVFLILEEPMKLVNGKIKRATVLFVDAAKVNVEQGTWKHTKIPNAEKGHHLRIVLTKDGVVKSIVRAIYV